MKPSVVEKRKLSNTIEKSATFEEAEPTDEVTFDSMIFPGSKSLTESTVRYIF